MAKKIIGYTCLVFILAFIWSNSANDYESSMKVSSMAAEIARAVFGETSTVGMFVQRFIRQIGHFVEFGLLGVCSVLLFILTGRLRVRTIINVLLLGLTTAVTDETIQIFFAGRTSAIRDVGIDMFGFVTFGAVALVVTRAWRTLDSRKNQTNEVD